MMTLDVQNVEVRRGQEADAEALVRVYRSAWGETYRDMIPRATLNRLVLSRGVERWAQMLRQEDVLVLRAAGEIAGYATFGLARRNLRAAGARGEIYELYMSPAYQGLGFGEYLFEGCRAQFDQRQLRGPDVWVLKTNTSAQEFYRRRGGRIQGMGKHRIGNVLLDKLHFSWD